MQENKERGLDIQKSILEKSQGEDDSNIEYHNSNNNSNNNNSNNNATSSFLTNSSEVVANEVKSQLKETTKILLEHQENMLRMQQEQLR